MNSRARARARGLFAPRPTVRAAALESFVTMSDSANVDDTPRGAERSLRPARREP